MKLNIDKIDIADFDLETFYKDYLKPEKPVVITNVNSFDTEKLTAGYIAQNFTDEAKKEAGWYDADLVDDGTIRIPDFVKSLLGRDDMSVRSSPMRIFMQPGGHVTLPHYDGNSLHGINQQVVGKKKWIITSPNTPLPNIPFMFAGAVGADFFYDETKYDFYEFETNPGDVLFLARYWYHEVHSLADININVNWVFTPKFPDESTALGRREVEIVKLRKSLPIVNKAFFPDKFDSYGGSGQELIENYSKDVSTSRMFKRLFVEMLGYPRMLMNARHLKKRAAEFDKNNFNIKQ